MVRKKNKIFVDSADRTPHYSLRKLSVGVASVLLSTTLWMGANGSVVHADTGTIDNNATANDAQVNVARQDQSQQNTVQPLGQANGQATGKESDPRTDTTKQEASDDLDGKKRDLASLIDRAAQDELNVQLEDAKTYTTKQDALNDLDQQVAKIQGDVTKYEAYDAAKKVYGEDLEKWNAAQKSKDPHMIKGISQGLSFANEHDASLNVTSGSDKKPVKFIKSSAWLGSDGMGVYTDGLYNGGNISKSFSDSDISDKQDEGTGTDRKDWGKTYTGVQLKVGESVVAGYTGLKKSVYIDKENVAHKLSKVQVMYTLNETTANDGTANIFLSNNPNIALWYGAAGNRNGRVDLTVDLTFYDENGNPITLGKDSNAWLDMSSLNNGTTKVEYFVPNDNPTKSIKDSTISKHNDGWYANYNNEGDSGDWDHPTSAHRYRAAAIMELDGKSFHIGQRITRNNVYSWFALDSSLAAAYKPVEPNEPNEPNIVWHEVTYEPQKATVTYIDDTDNKRTLSSERLEGDSNADSKYNTKSSIEGYEKKGYELVSDDTKGQNVVFDNDSSVDQRYKVHLTHGTVTVAPNDKTPVKPGDKINPNDPNSPKYKDDVKHDNLVKDAKQTVHYEGAGTDTPADSVTTQKDAFTRTVTYDKVTGESTTSDWSQPKTTFDKVDTPVVKGYTADKKQAGGLTATPDDPEVKDTVVYTPNGSIVPIDPNGNPIPNTPSVPYETNPNDPTKVVNGKVPEVPSWTPKNGKPDDPVVPTDPTKDTKVPYVHTMTPGETTVTGKQTVTYVYKDKDGKVVNTKTKTVEQDATFTGKTTKDEVTGKTTTTWDQKDHKYTEVTTPVVPGYTASEKSVGGDTVTPEYPNRSYEVVYTPNGSIVPIDPNGNPIPNTPSVPYETNPNDPTKVVNGKVPEVPSWTPKNGKPDDPVVPTDPTKDTKVPYVHTMTPGETTVTGKQTVTYVYKDKDGKVVNTKTKTVEQDATFTGKTTKDEVTGKTTTTWDQKDHKYTEVTTPVVPGYTASEKSVGGDTVTPEYPNRSYEVVYTPNGSIVPIDPNGNPIPNTPSVPYETNPNDPTKVVNGKVPEVPSWTPKNGKPDDPVVPTDPTKDTEVPYDHTKTPGKTDEPVKPGKTDEPVKPGKTDEPVKPGKTDEPVKPGKTDEPVKPGKTDEPVKPGKTDEPVKPGKTDEPVKPGKTDEPVKPGKTDEPVKPGKTDEPVKPGKGSAVYPDGTDKAVKKDLPAQTPKAPAEKLVKTPVKAPKAVKEASPAEMPAQKAAQAQDQLPQTGEDNSKAAFGLGLASILGGIGILGAFKRKKKEN